jgi:hypothetical protein
MLGYALSVLLDLLGRRESDRGVRVRAGHVLSALVRAVSGAADAGAVQTVRGFLPGVASGVGKVLCGDFKQGQGVFECALDVLEAMLLGVYADDLGAGDVADTDTDTIVARLSPLLEQTLPEVAQHSTWRVRARVVAFCDTVLRRCVRSVWRA